MLLIHALGEKEILTDVGLVLCQSEMETFYSSQVKLTNVAKVNQLSPLGLSKVVHPFHLVFAIKLSLEDTRFIYF